MSDVDETTAAGEPFGGGVAGSAGPGQGAGDEENAATRGSGGGRQRLLQATALLRQHTDSGWKAIEDSVIHRTLSLFRPSAPVRGRHELGDFFLAADVVVSRLRRRIDDVPRAAAQKIACTTTDRDELEQVTIQLIAAYGAPLLDVAGQVHTAAVAVLEELLGALAPTADRVRTHVHIGDVSNDPSIVV